MRKLILISILSFGFLTNSFSQNYGWTDISDNIPTEADLSDVFFISDTEGWITSSSHAEIYHTIDGGATFEIQSTQLACNAIHMLNENEGYAGGASGFIYKTANGGQIWDFYGTMVSNLTDISFPPNGEIGYCCGINGNIWSIDNTGVNKMVSNINGDLDAISFPISSEEGWVCGGSVLRHFTSSSWTGDQDYPSGHYNAIYMIDSLNGWAAGDNGAIIHTSDGHNWFTQQTNPAYIFTDLFFMNTQDGWVVGSGGGIFHSSNGGINWNIEDAGLSSSILGGVHFTSPTNGYVVGNNKTLLKYTEVSGVGENTQGITFELFPNPAGEKFIIRSAELGVDAGKVVLYEMNGRIVFEKTIDKGMKSIEIDASNLEAGMYLCMLNIGDRSLTQKIIKE